MQNTVKNILTDNQKTIARKPAGRFHGITMAELLAALVISAMVVSTTVALYINIQKSLNTIESKLDKSSFSEEAMQLMAEDLDRIGSADFDVNLSLAKKQDSGYEVFKLEIKNLLYGSDNKPQEFEIIVWQTGYNPETDRLTLYRARGGLSPEDHILDTQARENPDDLIFVPVCDGITYFNLEVYNGQAFGNNWTAKTMPTGIRGQISFAEPVVGTDGSLQLLQEDIYTRMIALNREKNLQFKFEKKDLEAIYGTGEEDIVDEDEEDDQDTGAENLSDGGLPVTIPEEMLQ